MRLESARNLNVPPKKIFFESLKKTDPKKLDCNRFKFDQKCHFFSLEMATRIRKWRKNGTSRCNALHIKHILESNPYTQSKNDTYVLQLKLPIGNRWRPPSSYQLRTRFACRHFLHNSVLINPGLKFNSVDTKLKSSERPE